MASSMSVGAAIVEPGSGEIIHGGHNGAATQNDRTQDTCLRSPEQLRHVGQQDGCRER